jgi:hypothetical protein
MKQKLTNRDIPWPKIHNLVIDTQEKVNVPLQENYTMEDMWYLDTLEARPIFEKQAKIIKTHNYKNILDVGCRHGPINKILHSDNYTDYNYFGYDTSAEPIEMAKKQWKDYENINYIQASWNDKIKIDIKPDVIIFSGVLLYIKDDNKRADFFDDYMFRLQCKNAIIQEPYHTQRHWDDRLILNTITNGGLDFLKEDYNVDEHYLDLPIFAGKRVIYDVTTKS